jgi:hypothetical protein
MQLSNEAKITGVKETTAGTTEVDSGAIDMQGYDGVMCVVRVNVNNAGNYLKAQSDVASGLGTVADIAGSKVVCTGADEFLFIDIYRPQKRYVQFAVIRGASTATGDMVILRYSGDKKPEVNATLNALAGVFLQSPADGTA